MKFQVELSSDDLRRIGAALVKRGDEAAALSKELLEIGRVQASEALEDERTACAELHVRLIKARDPNA